MLAQDGMDTDAMVWGWGAEGLALVIFRFPVFVVRELRVFRDSSRTVAAMVVYSIYLPKSNY